VFGVCCMHVLQIRISLATGEEGLHKTADVVVLIIFYGGSNHEG
jgi:hypothetical protein